MKKEDAKKKLDNLKFIMKNKIKKQEKKSLLKSLLMKIKSLLKLG